MNSFPLRPLARRIHVDTARPHRDISEIFTEMISSGSHPSTEHINQFMTAIYLYQPRAVTLFNINYRTQSERNTLKGLRLGLRRFKPQKNFLLVSGLPLQDPSAIGVNLYVAAMLSRMDPLLPCDVSIVPVSHPKEYERRWRKEVAPPSPAQDLFLSSAAPLPISQPDSSQWIVPENISLELRDTCKKPLEAYITRQNQYYVNIEVDMNATGSTMQFKSNSLSNLTSKGKHGRYFSNVPKEPETSPILTIHDSNSLLSPMIQAPTLVLELRSSQALNDEEVVNRGEEVIAMVQELLV